MHVGENLSPVQRLYFICYPQGLKCVEKFHTCFVDNCHSYVGLNCAIDQSVFNWSFSIGVYFLGADSA